MALAVLMSPRRPGVNLPFPMDDLQSPHDPHNLIQLCLSASLGPVLPCLHLCSSLPLQSHGEELRFVENGCHDNPTLDVASDSQSEMQEKKPSVNGGNTINGPDSWDVLINKQASEDVDVFEEDTHL